MRIQILILGFKELRLCMILYLGFNYIYQVNNVIKNILNAQHFLEFQVLKPFGPELLGFGQQNLI